MYLLLVVFLCRTPTHDILICLLLPYLSGHQAPVRFNLALEETCRTAGSRQKVTGEAGREDAVTESVCGAVCGVYVFVCVWCVCVCYICVWYVYVRVVGVCGMYVCGMYVCGVYMRV